MREISCRVVRVVLGGSEKGLRIILHVKHIQDMLKPIPGHHDYFAEHTGAIYKRATDGTLMRLPEDTTHGVSTHVLIGRAYRNVGLLILHAFEGPPPDDHERCHLDDDPRNNALDNLCRGTRRNNGMDRSINDPTYEEHRAEKCNRLAATYARRMKELSEHRRKRENV
jgi:hypothetical protein